MRVPERVANDWASRAIVEEYEGEVPNPYAAALAGDELSPEQVAQLIDDSAWQADTQGPGASLDFSTRMAYAKFAKRLREISR